MIEAGPSRQPRRISDLPYVLQQGIIKHVGRESLLSLMRVSKHFHRLAAERIYGRLTFQLSTPNTAQLRSGPVSRFTDAVQTLTTSEADYARLVRCLYVELANPDSETTQRDMATRYQHEDDATRILNNLLLIVFRKAKGLEVFRWSVPVELSKSVYTALGDIKSLHSVSLSLDTLLITKTTPAHPVPPPPVGGAAFPSPGSWPQLPLPPSALQSKSPKPPCRKVSAFVNLRQLELRGIDNLECVADIAACTKSNSMTLKTLTLSLSKHLIKLSKKSTDTPQANNQAQDFDPNDDDDDAMSDDYPPTNPSDAAPAASASEIKKIKTSMASFLAQVFGLEPVGSEERKVDRSLKQQSNSLTSLADQEILALVHWKHHIASKLEKEKSSGSADGSSKTRMNMFLTLRKAIDHYVASKKQPQAPPKPKAATNKKGKKVAQNKAKPPTTATSFPYSSSAFPTNDIYLPTFDLYDPTNSAPVSWTASAASTLNAKIKNLQYFLQHGVFLDPLSSTFPQPTTNNPDEVLSTTLPSVNPVFIGAETAQEAPPEFGFSFPLPGDPWIEGNVVNSDQIQPGPSSGSTSKKSSKKPANSASNIDEAFSESDSEEDDQSVITPPPPPPQVIVEEGKPAEEEDELDFDVDMEHPDILSGEDDVNDPEEADDNSDIDVGNDANALDVSKPQEAEVQPSGFSPDVTNSLGPKSNGIAITGLTAKGKGKQRDDSPLVNGSSTSEISQKVTHRTVKKATEDKTEHLSAEDIMRRYLRMKHGFSIESLNLYLTPTKPSVLGKALDLSCLKSISLLSVGPQGAFWTLMNKQQKEGVELQLRSIHTDDVSLAFLTFVSELPTIHNLYMLKRNPKDHDSTTSKVPATLEEIRTLVLRKHAKNLARLSIVSNDSTNSWDLDRKTIRLLAVTATSLKELACCIDSEHFHEFLRLLPRFQSLAALNLVKASGTVAHHAASHHHHHLNTREVRRSFVDVLDLAPSVTLKVLVVAGLPHRFKTKVRSPYATSASASGAKSASASTSGSKGKGKGKAKAVDFGDVAEEDDAMMGEDRLEGEEGDKDGAAAEPSLSDIENEGGSTQVQYPRLAELEREYAILRHAVRTGRL